MLSAMRHITLMLALALLLAGILNCRHNATKDEVSGITRQLVDTVGFAQYSWQMDTIMTRLTRDGWKQPGGLPWKMALCPHDDYTYVGKLYPEILSNIKATNLILIGVAHKAAQLGIADSLVFDSFDYWKGPWKKVEVSNAREEIFGMLEGKYAIISDTLHKVEHSIESMIPFLQYFNRNITIVPVLVPAMSPERMQMCARAFAGALKIVAERNRWEWGRDYAVIVTTDAVHYGNEDWGGADMAFFGCDSIGNHKALLHEHEIINDCLLGRVSPEKAMLFSNYTLNADNYKEYKWTWCGRYSVPFTLYLSGYLADPDTLNGEFIGYSTSITSTHLPVDDIRMGRTAIATDCHWVGYAAVGYR
jgi:AmmeMemoRadiSam system protein B